MDPGRTYGVTHLVDATVCRSAAFWVRVDQMSEGPSITVPKTQRLTAATLADWAADFDSCFDDQSSGGGHAS
jgi:hypothetical protein